MEDIAKVHGAAMDRIYRHQRHFYDLSRKHYLLGRDKLIRDLAPPPGSEVLELGCGTGRNLVAAAQRYPLCRFYGCDISTEMLKSAETSLARNDLSHRISLAHGDATRFDPRFVFRRNRFDRIYFSYTLSMIPGWRQAVVHALGLLAPKGELHIVDFGQCERLPGFFRAALFRWLAQFSVTPCADLADVLRHEVGVPDHDFFFTPLYRGYAWHAVVKSS